MYLRSLITSARLAAKGFRGNALNQYRLSSPSQLGDYLSYIQRQRAFRRLNNDVKHVVNDKFFFPDVIGKWSHLVPRNQIAIKNNRVFRSDFDGPQSIREALVHANGRLIAKPAHSLRGRGVLFLSLQDEVLFVNGKETDEVEFISSLPSDALYIICPHVRQHKAIADIFPSATATFRMLTFYDDEACQAEIVGTIARIGTNTSAPFETLILGGVTAIVDTETGIMSEALSIDASKKPSKVVSSETHPDTGAAIKGIEVPNWAIVRDTMVELCNDLPLLEMIGWDLVITDDGFQILEANVRPSQDVMQMHFPLLSNPRFRSFLARKGIL